MEGKSNYLKYGLHAAVLIGLVWATVKYVNGEEVWQAVQSFQYNYVPLLLGLALIYLLLKAARFTTLIMPFAPNLSKVAAYKAYIAGQAATLLPGGIAARAGLLKQIGIPIAEGTVPVAVHSAWDQALFIISTLIAALWFPEARLPVTIILAVLGVIALLLVIPTTREWLANLAESIARRFNYEEQWDLFLTAVPKVFTQRIVLICLALTVVALAIYITTLYVTLLGFDLTVSYPTLFVAVILPTMLGRIVPIPGGVGVTEASMVGFLSSLAQLDTDTTVGAVAIFRIVTIVFPAAIGALVYFLFWRGEGELDEGRSQLVATSTEATHAGSSDL